MALQEQLVVSMPDDTDKFTDWDEHLKNVCAEQFSDVESRLLTKIWHDDDDIEEELRERVRSAIIFDVKRFVHQFCVW
jgi:hypothetical protein